MFVDLFVATHAKEWASARVVETAGGAVKTDAVAGVPTLAIPAAVRRALQHLLKLGFDGFALSVEVDGGRLHRFKPFRVSFNGIGGPASDDSTAAHSVQSACLRPPNPRLPIDVASEGFFHALRLTIESSSLEHLVHITPSSLICKFYDVVAVKPGSSEEFSFLCNECECVDVICIDSQARLPFDMRLKDVENAVKRGISFEVTVASALRDPQTKRHLIANGSQIVRLTRGGKHVMINSGAAEFLECRAPQDLANLGTLMGMSYEHSRNAVSTVWKRVLEHGGKVGWSVVAFHTVRAAFHSFACVHACMVGCTCVGPAAKHACRPPPATDRFLTCNAIVVCL